MDVKTANDFLLNLNGTTAWETFSVILPSIFETFIAVTSFATICVNDGKFANLNQFVIDFLVIVVPIILNVTILVDHANVVLVTLFSIAALIFNTDNFKVNATNKQKAQEQNSGTYKYFVTNARSTISIITAVAILAVDFNVFPRRFAKTETFGYSLMDVGVGLYVYANGIVAPEIKEQKGFSFAKSVKSTMPLFILGSGRFFITKEIDYYVPVSEYGVHWNFFITLAATKILSSLILCYVNAKHSLYISLAVFILHEVLLMNGLTDWVFSDIPRDNFLAANREGISSSLGYVGLYFLSVTFGKLLLKSKSYPKLFVKLLLSSSILLSSTLYCEQMFGISRRLANSGYCLWICFIGVFMTGLYLGSEMLLKRLYANRTAEKKRVFSPLIYEAINFNGLTFFLVANLLTGAVNIVFNTTKQSTVNSLGILVLYMLVLCLITTVLYVKNVKIKLN